MKKVFMFLAVMGVMAFSAQNVAAQDETAAEPTATEEIAAPAEEAAALEAPEEVPMHQALKTKFIEGGAGFMALVIACLILGLALCIERILYLGFSKTNTKKLLAKIEEALANGGVAAAKDVCANTRGPIASIFYQGLLHMEEGLDVAEKSIIAYGSVQAGMMEKNLSWIGLFIGLCPNFGFMGTVIGMIEAFDRIQQAGDMSATIVAGGIKVALITTVFGLIGAIILQIFYNFILARIEAVVADMEDSSITMLDILTKNQIKK